MRYLYLGGFKAVNDRLGHETGDRLPVEFTNRMQGRLGGGDTVVRLGGDEFALLLLNIRRDEDARPP